MSSAELLKQFKPLLVAMLGLALILGFSAPALPARADINIFDSDPHLPEGLENLARGKQARSSSSYEMGNEGWGTGFINDGRIGETIAYGWSTNPIGNTDTATTPAWIQLDLAAASRIQSVAVWPRMDQVGANFPVDYDIEVSDDATNWTAVASSRGNTSVTDAQVLVLDEAADGRYIRMRATLRAPGGRDGALVQLAEFAVYGTAWGQSVQVDKPALELLPGETDQITPLVNGVETDPTALAWSSADESVATVTDGTVMAVALGSTTLTAASTDGPAITIPVSVIAERTATDSEFMISAFWPPTAAHLNAQQYDLLADAHITYIQNVDSTDLQGRETNLQMAALAAERGMRIGVADPVLNEPLNLSDEEIRDVVASWKNIPGVGGFYLKDEPLNANPYARPHRAVKAEANWLYPYVNFFPVFVYPNRVTYESQMDDYLELAGTDEADYLIYDLYPFGNAPDTLAYHDMLNNMASVRTVGAENGVKTGLYLQSIGRVNADGSPAGFRRTNAAEIRYEVNAALANGFKQISYFTWFTPTGRPELFTDAIIAPDGTPTDLYEPVKQLNAEVTALGPTLMGLDATEVYVHGPDLFQQQAVPSDFVVQFGDDDNVLVSRMEERDTGRQYVMVVNNNFVDAQDVEVQLTGGMTQVEVISRVDGTPQAATATDGIVSFTIAKGDAVLLRLPDGAPSAPEAPLPTNLAEIANVTATSSLGENGWYMDKLNDGIRFSEPDSRGWRATELDPEQATEVVLDLGAEHELNRIDIYPTGDLFTYADGFPGHVGVSVSSDAVVWTDVAESDLANTIGERAPSVTFGDVTARWIRLSFSDYSAIGTDAALQLSEIEVFLDDGTLPPPAVVEGVEETPWHEGKNLAFQRPVNVSSSYEAGIWGWSAQFLVDGQFGPTASNNGWTSAIATNFDEAASEWAAVHLGGPYLVDTVVLHPRNSAGDQASAGLSFPTDYSIEVSLDGQDWTTVAQQSGDNEISTAPRTIELDQPAKASFVRVRGTKLKVSTHERDGYLMQLGELQVYGNPVPVPGPEDPDPTESPTPKPTPEPTPTPDPTGKPDPDEITNPYVQPGLFHINGRWWVTVCEPYSQTVRCRTDIWATTVSEVKGNFVTHAGWAFNNYTYLPRMTRAQWAANPLGREGAWTAADGREWRTECDTPATGKGGCRSHIRASVIEALPRADGGYDYAWTNKWVFNNMVLFLDG